MFATTHITPLNFTLAPLWVLGKGFLCLVDTALRGLGHQCRREMEVEQVRRTVRQCNEIMGYVGFCAIFGPLIPLGSSPDVYLTGVGEIRVFHHPLT